MRKIKSKAFDGVKLHDILDILKKNNGPSDLRNLIQDVCEISNGGTNICQWKPRLGYIKTCVRPILSYTAEPERCIAGKTLRERIRELCKTQDILKNVKTRRKVWNSKERINIKR